MTLRVTFLGTSAAIPTTTRNPSGIFVNREGDQMLFDVGEGTQRQMMRYGTGFAVESVFLTHVHGDHILGLPGLLQTWDFTEREAPVTIYTPQGSADQLRQFLTALEDTPSYGMSIVEVGENETIVDRPEYTIQTVATDHRTRSVGYVLAERERPGRFDREEAEQLGVPVGPKFSQLHRGESVELADGTVIEPDDVVGPPRPGRRLVYTGDTRPTDSVVNAAHGADLLIHDATFTEEEADRARQTAHSTAREAGHIADQAGAKRLVLTHISSRYTGRKPGHVSEAESVFGGPVILANDGREIDIPYPDT